MADPITALGAVAAAVQLVDVALRASREMYVFLSAIKDAGKDIQNLREALRDVDSIVRNLRNYVAAFNSSASAIEEFEVLSDSITGAISGLQEDLITLKNLLPPSASTSIHQKVKHVYNRRKVRDVTRRLLERKNDLNLALSITGRLNDIRIRQELRQLSLDVKSEAHAIKVQPQQFRSTPTEHSIIKPNPLQDTAPCCRNTPTTVIYDNQNHGHSPRQPISGITAIGQVNTSDTTLLYMSCVSSLTEKLKSECRSVVKLAYEQSLAAFDTRNEAVLRQLELLSNHMSNDFDRYSQDTQHLRSLNRSSLGSGSHQKIKPKQHLTSTTISKDQHTVDREEIGSSHSPLVHLSSKKSRNTPITRHVWSFACMFGTIWVEIEWYRSNPLKHQVFSILAHFRPTNTLRFLPGISMCYSTAPTELGLYQIAPTISTFPVISTDHPIWRAIKESNVSSVQDLFASGIVNPKCQSENGITLLHYAAMYAEPDICGFLVTQGALCNQRDTYNLTPIFNVITGSLFQFTLGYRDLLAKDISMQGRKKTLQLLENAGGGLMEGFQTFLNLLAVQNSTLIVNGNIDAISNSIDFLLSTQIPAEDVWRLVLWHWPYSLMRPTPDAAIFLQVCLQKGLSPNLTTPEDRKPLLFRALAVMSLEKKWRAERKTMSNGDSGEYQGRQSIHANVSENEIPIIDGVNEGQLDYELTGIVELLIKAGADIYYQEQWCFDTAEPGNFSIWQPSDVAFRLGVLNEWHTALRNCGFDSDEIDYEGTRRDREAVRLRGVKRTGIDESVLSLPSYRGLRCRRCRRRFCSTHSPFHFCFN